jgi:hypothetical protein
MSITSTGSATQSVLQQVLLQQAQQRVVEAQQTANALQSQAQNAQTAVATDQAQANALWQQAENAQTDTTNAYQQLQAAQTLGQTGSAVNDTLSAVLLRSATSQAAAASAQSANPASTQTAPVHAVPASGPSKATVNTQGQTVGTIINTTA